VKTITLRNMDEDLKCALQREAKEHNSSLNGAALNVLRTGLGLTKPPRRRRNHELAKLAGKWTNDDLANFERATALTREIDAELWR
jgi:plasmid stability protein